MDCDGMIKILLFLIGDFDFEFSKNENILLRALIQD